MSEMIIYENSSGDIKVDVTFEDENLWLSQAQLCKVFDRAKGTISEHISNIFIEKELEENAVVREYRTTASDGKGYIKYKEQKKQIEREESFKELEADIKRLK